MRTLCGLGYPRLLCSLANVKLHKLLLVETWLSRCLFSSPFWTFRHANACEMSFLGIADDELVLKFHRVLCLHFQFRTNASLTHHLIMTAPKDTISKLTAMVIQMMIATDKPETKKGRIKIIQLAGRRHDHRANQTYEITVLPIEYKIYSIQPIPLSWAIFRVMPILFIHFVLRR